MDYPHPEELREGPERDEEPMCISVWHQRAVMEEERLLIVVFEKY